MADSASPQKNTAESPTTARPIEFDDDQQEMGIIESDATTTAVLSSEPQSNAQQPPNRVRFEDPPNQETLEDTEIQSPPTKPPRPTPHLQQAEHTLIEAFPSVDPKVVKAVLMASGGQVEPAFNALLGMSDPDYKEEAPAPPRPPRPTAEQRQMEQDEMYARQLAQQYGSASSGFAPRTSSLPQARLSPQDEQREHSFFEDELPEIGENLRQEFFRTQTKLSKWISDFRKKIDGEDEEHDPPVIGQGSAEANPGTGPMQADPQTFGYQRSAADFSRTRRSTDRDRYDDDPQVLSSNFTELELRDDGPVDEVDAAYGKPAPVERQASPAGPGGKSNKWQPLTSIAPNPEADDNDPFSLGDSDDERQSKSKDVRAEDTARLKSMAQDASNEPSAEQTSDKTLEPAETSGAQGTRNKEAEDLLNK